MWNVDFYRTKDNIAPIEDFLENLEPKMRAKAIHELKILEQFGAYLREPHSKAIENGVFELRSEIVKALKYKADYERRCSK